jgi:MFS family permease
MWRLGFFFHEMAFGLLSIFIPLYMVANAAAGGLGGSLVDLGIMVSSALLCSMPASFFWGYICDKTRRYKAYILLSFMSTTIILYVFTLTSNVAFFIILYVIMSMLHVAHEAPKNVLIAEHYSREEWEKSYSFYQRLAELGWLIGLFLGLIASTSSLTAQYTLLLCSGLNLVAFVLTIFLVTDPIMIFERRLVSIEKKIDLTYRGAGIISQILEGLRLRRKFKEESFVAFGIALVFFSLASSTFFTPLPIFFVQDLGFPTAMVFMIYMLHSGGAIAGYFFVSRRASDIDAKTQIRRIALFRSLLVFLLVAVVQRALFTTLFSVVVLVLLNFAYAVYYVLALSLSMELMPAGRTGVFDVLIGLGTASGSFLGPFLAQTLGFLPQFSVAAVIFFLAFAILRIFS